MDETVRDPEPPILQRRFTHQDACAASTMSGPRLRKWTTSGALQRFIPLREEGRWLRFSFCDCVTLALAQGLMNMGIGSKRAFAWADEAARALWESEFYGTMLIYQPTVGPPGLQVVHEIGAETVSLFRDMECGAFINCRRVAGLALARLGLAKALAVASPFNKNTISDVLRGASTRGLARVDQRQF